MNVVALAVLLSFRRNLLLLEFPLHRLLTLASIRNMARREHNYFVYIAASRSRQLYVGVTNSVERRMKEHRQQLPGTYTARYRIDRLVYYELHAYILNAIARETELKSWTRERKVELITAANPTWDDLFLRFGTTAAIVEKQIPSK